MYIYIYTYIYIHRYMIIHTHTLTHTHTHNFTHTLIHSFIFTQTIIDTLNYIYISIYIYIYIYMCVCVNVCLVWVSVCATVEVAVHPYEVHFFGMDEAVVPKELGVQIVCQPFLWKKGETCFHTVIPWIGVFAQVLGCFKQVERKEMHILFGLCWHTLDRFHEFLFWRNTGL